MGTTISYYWKGDDRVVDNDLDNGQIDQPTDNKQMNEQVDNDSDNDSDSITTEDFTADDYADNLYEFDYDTRYNQWIATSRSAKETLQEVFFIGEYTIGRYDSTAVIIKGGKHNNDDFMFVEFCDRNKHEIKYYEINMNVLFKSNSVENAKLFKELETIYKATVKVKKLYMLKYEKDYGVSYYPDPYNTNFNITRVDLDKLFRNKV